VKIRGGKSIKIHARWKLIPQVCVIHPKLLIHALKNSRIACSLRTFPLATSHYWLRRRNRKPMSGGWAPFARSIDAAVGAVCSRELLDCGWIKLDARADSSHRQFVAGCSKHQGPWMHVFWFVCLLSIPSLVGSALDFRPNLSIPATRYSLYSPSNHQYHIARTIVVSAISGGLPILGW
jgi:hypothetical protein